MSEKKAFLEAWNRESATTLKVLRAFPAGKEDLKPHDSCRTAKELAWTFVFEGYGGAQGVHGEVKWPPPLPPMPENWTGMVGEVDRAFRKIADEVKTAAESQLDTSVKFMTGPKQMGDVRRLDFLWFLLNDMIHHRGQFTVYLRMAGGKVPSIYGPSKDEPWR